MSLAAPRLLDGRRSILIGDLSNQLLVFGFAALGEDKDISSLMMLELER